MISAECLYRDCARLTGSHALLISVDPSNKDSQEIGFIVHNLTQLEHPKPTTHTERNQVPWQLLVLCIVKMALNERNQYMVGFKSKYLHWMKYEQ